MVKIGKDTFKRSKEVRKHHYNHWQFEKKPSYEERKTGRLPDQMDCKDIG